MPSPAPVHGLGLVPVPVLDTLMIFAARIYLLPSMVLARQPTTVVVSAQASTTRVGLQLGLGTATVQMAEPTLLVQKASCLVLSLLPFHLV